MECVKFWTEGFFRPGKEGDRWNPHLTGRDEMLQILDDKRLSLEFNQKMRWTRWEATAATADVLQMGKRVPVMVSPAGASPPA